MIKVPIIIACILVAVIGSTTALHSPPAWRPHAPGLYYCNNQPYSRSSSICCNSQILPTTSYKRPACCGTAAFDRDAKLCCAGSLQVKSTTRNACCGTAPIDASTTDCCNGLSIPVASRICCAETSIARVTIFDVCCGSARMDRRKSLCCQNTVKKIDDSFPGGINTNLHTYACCGSTIYKTNTNMCSNGIVYPKHDWHWKPWWNGWWH